jgi:hypothetical protein
MIRNWDLKSASLAPAIPGERVRARGISYFAFRTFFGFLISGFGFSVAAQESITFPLQGYYHPGRYMPVHVYVVPQSSHETDGQVCLTSSGSLWTFVRYEGGTINTTVPWMAIDGRAVRLHWRRGFGQDKPVDLPLKPLDEHQRIVGYAGVSAADAVRIAALLYTGDAAIPVALDATNPLPGNPAAWDTLDAIVLDAQAASRLTEHQLAILVAGGTAFAVRARSAPWPEWPWKQAGGAGDSWWTLHHVPAGPQAVVYDEAIFLPVANWHSGWAAIVRQRFVVACAIFCCVLLALTLWRWRYVALMAVLVTGIFIGLLAFWGRWHFPTLTIGSKIRVIDHGITQDDDWVYQTSHVQSYSMVRWVDTTRLMYASPRQLDVSHARIVCYPNGDPDFVFTDFPPNGKIALLARRAGPRAPSAQPTLPVTSPMLSLVKERYLISGDEIAGELPTGPILAEPYLHEDQWPAVVIERHSGR